MVRDRSLIGHAAQTTDTYGRAPGADGLVGSAHFVVAVVVQERHGDLARRAVDANAAGETGALLHRNIRAVIAFDVGTFLSP